MSSPVIFLPPPGWPALDPGVLPPATWQPHSDWPPPPAGWVFYRDLSGRPIPAPRGAWQPTGGKPGRVRLIIGVIVVIMVTLVGAGVGISIWLNQEKYLDVTQVELAWSQIGQVGDHVISADTVQQAWITVDDLPNEALMCGVWPELVRPNQGVVFAGESEPAMTTFIYDNRRSATRAFERSADHLETPCVEHAEFHQLVSQTSTLVMIRTYSDAEPTDTLLIPYGNTVTVVATLPGSDRGEGELMGDQIRQAMAIAAEQE